jgi:hypothetical protein
MHDDEEEEKIRNQRERERERERERNSYSIFACVPTQVKEDKELLYLFRVIYNFIRHHPESNSILLSQFGILCDSFIIIET